MSPLSEGPVEPEWARRDLPPGSEDEPAVNEPAKAPPALDALVHQAAVAINEEGAYCGDCDYEGGLDCPDCLKVCTGYARVALEAAARTAQPALIADKTGENALAGWLEEVFTAPDEGITWEAAAAELFEYGAVREEHKVRADAVQEVADESGVNVGDHSGDWWDGYRQAQRETVHRLTARAAALRAEGGT